MISKIYMLKRRLNFTGFFLLNENVAFFSPEATINEHTVLVTVNYNLGII